MIYIPSRSKSRSVPQHNNGGFAVDKWWQSNIPHTFIIGEMAGTHGVKRPGGSALNAGQTGGLRAAEYIVNVYGSEIPDYSETEIENQVNVAWASCPRIYNEGFRRDECKRGQDARDTNGLIPQKVLEEIRSRMTASGGHIRELNDAKKALGEAVKLYKKIKKDGFNSNNNQDLILAIQAEHLALTSVAYLKAIVDLLELGSGSRGSHLVLDKDGIEIHPKVINKSSEQPLRFKPENESLRNSILQVEYDENSPDLFKSHSVELRKAPTNRKAFEPAWRDYREGKIYS